MAIFLSVFDFSGIEFFGLLIFSDIELLSQNSSQSPHLLR